MAERGVLFREFRDSETDRRAGDGFWEEDGLYRVFHLKGSMMLFQNYRVWNILVFSI